MSATLKINFPTIPIANSGQVIGGDCNAFIDWWPGTTSDHFVITLGSSAIYTNIYVNKIAGEFRQYDINGNLLRKSQISITQGNSLTIFSDPNTNYIELYINYIELIYGADISLNIDTVLSGLANTVITIQLQNASGITLASLTIQPNKIITTAKIREIVTVQGQPPVIRVFNITTVNTNPYIKEWWAEIKSVTGTPQSSDTIILELLDANDNVLASNNVGIAVGNKIAVQHNTNAAKVRVTLNSNVRGLSVDIDVSEAIDITVS